MTSSHLTHDVVCIGSYESTMHEFHATNARSVRALFSGGLGPPRAFVECVAGQRLRVEHLTNALAAAASRSAPNLVFYFSGKSSTSGLCVGTNIVDARTIQAVLANISAQNLLLLFDLDIGAGVDAGLSPDWLRRLVAAIPGARAAVCRATRIGSGAHGEGLGRFTAALISALESEAGDLRFEQSKFISDKLVVERSAQILNERWGMTSLPVIIGELGAMPLSRSQQATALGVCVVSSVKPLAGLAASVTWAIEGRANVATMLHYALVRSDGSIVCEAVTKILPTNPAQKGKTSVKFAKRALGSRMHAPPVDDLAWHISLLDSRGRVLAHSVAKLT